MLLIAALWLFTAILTLVQPVASLVVVIILAALMLANAGIMLWLARGIGRQSRRHYYLSLGVLGAIVFLSFTDQFGWYDLLALLLTLIAFVLLLATRSLYTAPGPE